MKKSFLMATSAMVLFAACQKEAANNGQNEVVDDNSPVPVLLSVGSPTVSVKSAGAVGGTTAETNKWNNETLFVYAFDRSNAVFEEPLINGVAVTAKPETDNPATAMLDLKQEADAEIDGVSVAGEYFYYQGETCYDFYGYYIDDAYAAGNDPATVKPVLDEESNSISIPVEINGAQDLMIAKANQQLDIDRREGDVKPVSEGHAYSAYSARRDVIPNLSFEHLLTRFTFVAKAGHATAYDININKLQVTSKYKADFVVVAADGGRGLKNIGTETTKFTLQENVGGVLQDMASKAFTKTYDSENPETLTFEGSSIMVIPGETSYTLTLSTSLKAGNTPTEPYDVTIKLKNGAAFEAGKSYEITVVIYGPQKVEVEATLQQWKEGDDVEIDPDEDWAKEDAELGDTSGGSEQLPEQGGEQLPEQGGETGGENLPNENE